MDYSYELGWTTSKVAGGTMMKFSIERARSRSSYWVLFISTGTMIGYGWALSRATHPAVILALRFLQGICLYTRVYVIRRLVAKGFYPCISGFILPTCSESS
ncbi:hypothetical protein CC79DRAFT_1129027 [Sarocladium strictum]